MRTSDRGTRTDAESGGATAPHQSQNVLDYEEPKPPNQAIKKAAVECAIASLLVLVIIIANYAGSSVGTHALGVVGILIWPAVILAGVGILRLGCAFVSTDSTRRQGTAITLATIAIFVVTFLIFILHVAPRAK